MVTVWFIMTLFHKMQQLLYYKMRQLLQNVTINTKRDVY